MADMDVVTIQRRYVEDVPAVGEVGGAGVAEAGTVGGEHDLSVHGEQMFHRLPGLEEGEFGQLLAGQTDPLDLVGGEGAAVEDVADLAGAGHARSDVGVVRRERVDGEYARECPVLEVQLLRDLAPAGVRRVLVGVGGAAGQQPPVVLAVGGVHQQDTADLVGDDRGGTEPDRVAGRGVPHCRQRSLRRSVIRGGDGRGHGFCLSERVRREAHGARPVPVMR